MDGASLRWHGQRSPFPWEEDALQYVKAKVPHAEPYRAWQTFKFTASTGHVREVDLFIAAPGGLFLVEIKSHPGRATNSGSTWMFRDDRVTRTFENPLPFTDQKAKELRAQLDRAAKQLKVREHVPRIEPVVFLSAENLVCAFDEFQRQRVFARDEISGQTTLDGIWRECLYQPPRSERNRVTPTFSRQLPKIMEKVGIARLHRLGKVGSYELDPKSYDSGPTWEDYLAHHTSMPNLALRRVRVYLAEQKATDAERESVRRAAHREYLALQGIAHDGIVRAETYSDELLTGPAVVFVHGTNWQRLDHYMAAHGSDLPLDTRLEMLRQLAEALDHAHRRHLFHRALAARCVYVEMDGNYPRLRIADWQVAAHPAPGTTLSALGRSTPSSLAAHVERSAGAYLAPEFTSPDAPAEKLDMFGLGALSYLILTGQPPAAGREQLLQNLQTEGALVPSAVADSLAPEMDALVRGATVIAPAARTDTAREFLKSLDEIEEKLTAPDATPEIDPLNAIKGDEIAGWTVERILGKGSTSRALLVTRDGHPPRVFKIALNDPAARRLRREAGQLGQLTDSRVLRLLDEPFEAGPLDKRRTIIGVEYVGDHTLADELREHGPLTIHELERLGEDLFQALKFLDGRDVWHRDVKPDNLALRRLERKGRELVLFDFSLAGTPDTELEVGTRDYLDPFLGPPRRTRYDQAAELYAVAVTLHEMASGERPSWGDGLIPSSLLDPSEEVRLSEDLFDPVVRDGLVNFFRMALHRDASQRFRSLREMTHAWTGIFADLDTVPPLTTASTLDDESTDAAERRRRAAESATWDTPLNAAGLSPHALSIAQRLGASTVGDLVRIPPARVTRLRGIGSNPRYELVRRIQEWGRLHTERAVVPLAPSPDSLGGEDLDRLSVDDLVRRLVPESAPELRRVVGLEPASATGSRLLDQWASQRDIAGATGLSEEDVAVLFDRLRSRWTKSVPALTKLREQVVEILCQHGRILEWRQLATALLAERGSAQDDPQQALRLAAACVRAAVEAEERLDSAGLATWRIANKWSDEKVLIALTAVSEDATSSAGDLFAYAELLGSEADKLAARDPLPGVNEVQQTLRAVLAVADGVPRLSDTDLVLLAAAASRTAAASPRLELYPRDLPPERALKISQAGSLVSGERGIPDAELARRVTGRFPELLNPPQAADILPLLRELGYNMRRDSHDALLYAATATAKSTTGTAPSRSRTAAHLGVGDATLAWRRLNEARERGGFVTLKLRTKYAAMTCAALTAVDGVTAVNVSAEFVRLLREIVTEQGRPRWETVLAADSPGAPPTAKAGFVRLLDIVWERLQARIRNVDNSIVLLHDATPLARYTGGADLLAKLAGAARMSGESPYGLWLLCPMQDPKEAPRLDSMTIGVIPGDAEQIVLPDDFAAPERRAS
ncbi:MAG: BREX system serine/threonine kinase PglW [Streptosporangiaceae bacterium]